MTNAAILYKAQVIKVQTMTDGAIRLTVDLVVPTNETVIALLDARQPGIILECAAVAIDIEKQKETTNAIQEGRKRQSKWTPAKVPSIDSDT
jgi:hypothetical protein